MKRYLLLAFLVGCSGVVGAAVPAGDNISSFTTTSDSASIQAAYLDAIVTASTSSSSNGVLTIFSSTWTSNLNATNLSSTTQVTKILLTTNQTYPFYNTKVRGIFYVITNNSAGVTIIYKK